MDATATKSETTSDSNLDSTESKEGDVEKDSQLEVNIKSKLDDKMESTADSSVSLEDVKPRSLIILEGGDPAVDCKASLNDSLKQDILSKELQQKTDNVTMNPQLTSFESVVASVSSELSATEDDLKPPTKITLAKESEHHVIDASLEHSDSNNSNVVSLLSDKGEQSMVKSVSDKPSEPESVVCDSVLPSVSKGSEALPAQPNSSGSANTIVTENTNQLLTHPSGVVPNEQEDMDVYNSGTVMPIEGHKEVTSSIAEDQRKEISLRTTEQEQKEMPETTAISSTESSFKTTEAPKPELIDVPLLSEKSHIGDGDNDINKDNVGNVTSELSGDAYSCEAGKATEKVSDNILHSNVLNIVPGRQSESFACTEPVKTDIAAISDSEVSSAQSSKVDDKLTTEPSLQPSVSEMITEISKSECINAASETHGVKLVVSDVDSIKGDINTTKLSKANSADVSDSGTVSSDNLNNENALITEETTKPKDTETSDSNGARLSTGKLVSECIHDESSVSSDSLQSTGSSDNSKTSNDCSLQTAGSSNKVMSTPEPSVSAKTSGDESNMENMSMSESMNISDSDNSKSDLIEPESQKDVKYLESTPTTDLETDISDCQTKVPVTKENMNSVQVEETKLNHELFEQDKGINNSSTSEAVTVMSENITVQEEMNDSQSSMNIKDLDSNKTVHDTLKDVQEESCQIKSQLPSVLDEDHDTRSSTSDSKVQVEGSICRDEDSRASFVSASNETDMEVDLAADESNQAPAAGDADGNEVSDFNEDSNASKSCGPQPKHVTGNGKMFPLRDLITDETSMSSVVTADSVDSENIPLARMVDESDNFPLSSLVPYSDSMPATPASGDTASDAGPTPAKRSRRDSLTNAEDELNGFPAENLFEYQWPQDGGEWYMLQEQLSEFLQIKSFKRKYPDLYRRTADKVEKDFLRHRGAVTETQSDLGLTALRSEEVYDLMLKDYPDKYQEYANVLHEREKKTIRDKHKEYGVPKLDKCKMADYIKKAVRSAAEFNAHMQRERKEERRSYFDLQTFMIHYPMSKFKKLAPELTKPGPYPVALIPGQFQNYYKRYTPDELKYLPINTVMYDPPSNRGSKLAKVSSGESSSDIEDNAEDKGESGSDNDSDDSSDSDNSSSDDDQDEEKEAVPPKVEICRICKEAVLPASRRNSLPQDTLIKCSECGATGHPSCLDLPKKMVAVIKTYPWQCMECKTCVECLDPFDEDKMMFCDRCDRGYHTFCVGLKAIPTGRWECRSCKGTDTPKSKRSRH